MLEMSSAGTLLSDLNDKASTNDGDLVRQIIAGMNDHPTAPPPPMGNNIGASLPPVNNAAMHMMDPNVPTAHMIGSQHPSAADFANLLQHAPVQQAWSQQQQVMPSTQKNLSAKLLEEARLPILVAIVVFVITLPAVTVLFAHYAPYMLKPGGDLNTYGMVVRALLAGASYWLLQRVIAPLLSL